MGGGFFRDKKGMGLWCFVIYLGIENYSFVELFSTLLAVKIAFSRGWFNLCLEYDSSWVVDIFNDKTKPRRNLSNFWDHCSTRNLHITHIFREGNGCADKLANFGVYNRADFWWDETPSFLLNEFIRNTFQLHSYRFRFV
ncbi:putative ribonuclease H-like domain-containing protein [Lupinus albus]|uniref:Putative ribonuclease H-like domain-containing protein n=1 Tax=Lupinus albus TaxID=3870 RepID=A0A6A4Q8X0_LUPAL|nr:putative ribonuclease H-like domain-containing protein [Lupinus albus]